MILTKSQCEQFRSNKTVNPLTGRTISKGKITYLKLTQACEDKKSPSPKIILDHKAPPMGPMIHWRLNAEVPTEERNNMLKFLKYIQATTKELEENNEQISKLFLEDMIDILKEGASLFADKGGYVKLINKLIEQLKTLKLSNRVYNDVPKATIVAYLEVKPSRKFIRGRVLRCYSLWKSIMNLIEGTLLTKKIQTHASRQQLDNVLEQKEYLDYVIKHKIFTYDDIWKNTFPNDKAYDTLKVKYEEYIKLYKEIKAKAV
jgi:hypothetical protein